MFDSKHYVPILKWKAAEQEALAHLKDAEKKFMTPLLQLMMPQAKRPKDGEKPKTPQEQLVEIVATFREKSASFPEEVLKCWGKNPVFVDPSLIYVPKSREEGIKQILDIAESLDLQLIPVVNLSSDEDMQKIVSEANQKYGHGVCLRLTYSDLEDTADFADKLKNFLQKNSLSEKEVDLLIDLKDIYDDDSKYEEAVNLSQDIPNLFKWRTFTFASGAFPVDLTEFKVGENIIARTDWKYWLDQISSPKLKRLPSFADYTIQHPIYKPSAMFFSPSASIRYTLRDNWAIMRGQKNNSKQYLGYAQLISKQKYFFGEKFSFGDEYILNKGKDLKGKTGNAKTWLVAGINHHLACTIDQISNLP